MSETFAISESIGPVGKGSDGLLPGRRKAALQPWAGFDLGPKELAGQRRIAPVAALLGVLCRDQNFLGDASSIRQDAGELVEYQAALARQGYLPRRLDLAASQYVRTNGYPRRVMVRLLAEASTLEDPRWVLQHLTLVAVFVDGDLTDEDPRHWPHAKGWQRAAQLLAALRALEPGGCPYPLERHGRLECCATVPASANRDGRKPPYCGRHRPETSFEKSAARSDREAITNLLSAVGKALEVPREPVANPVFA